MTYKTIGKFSLQDNGFNIRQLSKPGQNFIAFNIII